MRPVRSTRSVCVHRFDVLSRPKRARRFESLKDAVGALKLRDPGFRAFRRVTARFWSAGGHGEYAFAHPATAPCPEAWTR
jgi:hypothetical protein